MSRYVAINRYIVQHFHAVHFVYSHAPSKSLYSRDELMKFPTPEYNLRDTSSVRHVPGRNGVYGKVIDEP